MRFSSQNALKIAAVFLSSISQNHLPWITVYVLLYASHRELSMCFWNLIKRTAYKAFPLSALSFAFLAPVKLYFNVVFELFPCGISFMPGRFTNAASPAAHRSTTGPEIRWIRMAGRSFCGRRRHGGRRRRIPQGAEPRRPCGRGGAGGFARVFGRGMQKGRSRAAPPFLSAENHAIVAWFKRRLVPMM